MKLASTRTAASSAFDVNNKLESYYHANKSSFLVFGEHENNARQSVKTRSWQ